jgi:hypothetical protein
MTDREREIALREAEEIAVEEEYFSVRPDKDYGSNRMVFMDGFRLGWQARGAQLEPAPQEKLIYVGVRSTTAQSTVNFVEPDEELERALNNWFDANPNLEESSQMDLAMAAYRLGRESRQEKPLAFVDKDVWALVKSKLENGIDSVGFFRMIRHSNKDIPLYTSPPAQPDSVPIKLTPEMIEAGVNVYWSPTEPIPDCDESVPLLIEQIWSAMIAAQEKV